MYIKKRKKWKKANPVLARKIEYVHVHRREERRKRVKESTRDIRGNGKGKNFGV